MTETQEELYNTLGWSTVLHILIAVAMTMSWIFHSEQVVIRPPAMMKAALVHAPKSTLQPQQKTQTQKPEPVKPKPQPEPEPPKPDVVKPKDVKPDVKPSDKPSPIAAKPDQPAPTPKPVDKKQPDKKAEPVKPDAKQAEKKQKALSQKQKDKISQDAEMALEALLNDEAVTRTGDLT